MSTIKFRIVKKEKSGITLSPAKGAETVKMTWEEFEQNWTIKEDIWATPKESTLAKINEADDYLNQATASFIIAGGLKGTPNTEGIAHLAVLAECTNKVQEILGCTNAEALALIRQRLDLVTKGTTKKPSKNFKKNKSQKPNQKPTPKNEPSGFAVLADNPRLLALKEKFNSK